MQDALSSGSLAFSAPDRVTVNQVFEVEAQVSRELSPAALAQRLGNPALARSRTLKVFRSMKAALQADATLFRIEALSPAEQLLGSEPARWHWSVTALNAAANGSHPLLLNIEVVVKDGDRELLRHVEPFRELIHVAAQPLLPDPAALLRAAPAGVGGQPVRSLASQWVGEHWQWLAGSVVLPFIAWWWSQRRAAAPLKRKRR